MMRAGLSLSPRECKSLATLAGGGIVRQHRITRTEACEQAGRGGMRLVAEREAAVQIGQHQRCRVHQVTYGVIRLARSLQACQGRALRVHDKKRAVTMVEEFS